jgi:hypothetical protein
MSKWFVHYTAQFSGSPAQFCVEGPYSDTEVLDRKQQMDKTLGISNVFISETRARDAA